MPGPDVICLPFPAMVHSKLLSSLAHGTARSFSLYLHIHSCSLKYARAKPLHKSGYSTHLCPVDKILKHPMGWPGATHTSLPSLRVGLCPFHSSPGTFSPFSTQAFHTLPSIYNLDYNFSNQVLRRTFLVGPAQASLEFWGRGSPPALAGQLEKRCVPAPGPPSPLCSQH